MGDTEQNKIVKADSAAYGYNYASLADIVKQGFEIPKMRIMPGTGGRDYIEYLGEDKEWHIGAQIVVPEMKGMNAAQAYGSALTYARRYTAQMALALACDDDQKLEKSKPQQTKQQFKKSNQQTPKAVVPASDKQIKFLVKLLEDLGKDAETIAKAKLEATRETSKTVSGWIQLYQKELEKNKSADNLPTEEEVNELAG